MKSLFTLTLFLSLLSSTVKSQWQQMPSGTTDDLDGIHFFDNQTGITSSSFTNTIKTTDGGTNWSVVSSFGIRDFSFVDNNFGYGASAVGQSMSKSTDGGNTWTSITPPTSNSLWGVSATSSSTAHFVGTGGVYWYTTNGGATVNVGNSGITGLCTDVFFTSPTNGFIVGQTGKIQRTLNGGSTWSTVYTYTGPSLLTEMHFVDDNLGFVVGGNGTILRTTDGGTNWTTQTSNSTSYFQSVHFHDANSGVVVGTGGEIYFTTNGGDTWDQSVTGITERLNDVRMISANEAIVIGDNGLILKNSNIASSKVEDELDLTVYPNPVTTELQIKSDVKFNSIQIIDLEGKLMYSDDDLNLLNNTIDVSYLSSGLYFVNILFDDHKIVRKFSK